MFKKYDVFEVQHCISWVEESGIRIFEVIDDNAEETNATCWTVYGHIPGEGVEALADCPTKEIANSMKKALEAWQIVGALVRAFPELNTDEPLDGGDAVQVLCDHWQGMKATQEAV